MINDFKTEGERKIQLTMAVNSMSSKNSKETRTVHSKSNNMETMIVNKTDEIIEKVFDSLLQKHQNFLKESLKGSEYAFYSVDVLHDKCYKISLNEGGSYNESPNWLKSQKAIINFNNDGNKQFQYATTVVLDHKSIVKGPQRISKIKLFINKQNQKEINFPSRQNDQKNFKTNNKTIALDMLYVPSNSE